MIKFAQDENISDLERSLIQNEGYFEAILKSRLRLPHFKESMYVWIIYDMDGAPCGAIDVMGNEMMISLSGSDRIDFGEIANFIMFRLPKGKILCDRKVGIQILNYLDHYGIDYSEESGNIMHYQSNCPPSTKSSGYNFVDEPSVEGIYRAMCRFFPEYEQKIPFDAFYTTTIYKRNHDQAFFTAIEDRGVYIGIGGCFSMGYKTAVISDIVVADDYRRRGIASQMIGILTEKSLERRCKPLLSSATFISDSLYLKHGYDFAGQWINIDLE